MYKIDIHNEKGFWVAPVVLASFLLVHAPIESAKLAGPQKSMRADVGKAPRLTVATNNKSKVLIAPDKLADSDAAAITKDSALSAPALPVPVLTAADKHNRKVVDKTLAIIYHPEGSTVILQSDLRPDLTDATPTLRDVVLRELIVLDAKKFKIAVTDAEVDRHLARIQESLKKSREDLIEFFNERGYTFDQAKKELEKGLLIETTIGERVKRKAIVPESEIKRQYNERLEILYTIKQAFVPYGMGSKVLARATVDRQIESGEILTAAQWGEAAIIKEKDISPEKGFIKEIEPGTVTIVQETDEGITLIQLISKCPVPYETMKTQIMSEMGMKRYNQELSEYYENLLSKTPVRYLDKSLAPKIKK